MKRFLPLKSIILILLLLVSGISYSQNGKENLNLKDWVFPYPKDFVIVNKEFFNMDTGFEIVCKDKTSKRLNEYISNIIKRIKLATSYDDFALNIVDSSKHTIEICFSTISDLSINSKEDYTIDISKDKVLLSSNTDVGAMRGLETLFQLVRIDSGRSGFQCLKIADSPRFLWRGLMIDVCRHFIPKDVIKRNLDAMAMFKMNVFHWHLSEDQGFRVECKTFPKLHEMGSDGKYFTHEDVKEIIKYANDRGIRVVPEFDIPGHSTAWFVGYPEYASEVKQYEIERHYGVFDPTFDPTKEETYEFFDKFFKEMSELFNDEYIHIGGDENSGKQWDSSSTIKEFKKANNLKSNHELQAYFNKRIQKILEKYGKKMIGWDEILSTELPKSIMIHSWQGKEGMVTAAKNGYYSILSNGYYIDLCQSMVDHYYNDPLPDNIDLTSEQKNFIVGGEATMWSELVDSNNIDTRIWPRTAAIAEVLWSGRKTFGKDSIYNNEMMFLRTNYVVPLYLEFFGISYFNYYISLIKSHGKEYDKMFSLAGYLEPVKYYNRHRYTKYSQSTPLNRLVDFAKPDPIDVVNINNSIGRKLRGEKVKPPKVDLLILNGEELIKFGNDSHTSELLPLVVNINLSLTIFKELMIFEKGDHLDNEKYIEYKNQLTKLKEPVAELEIPYVENLLKLLEYLKASSK